MASEDAPNDRNRSQHEKRRAFVLRRLHSLSGVVPLGGFLVEHLWTNSSALGGKGEFDRAVGAIQSLPALPLFEIGLIFLPLAFHAFYGIAIARSGSVNVRLYPTARNWAYLMQRLSGVVTLAFVLFHLYEFRMKTAFFGMPSSAFYDTLSAHLSSTTFGIPLVAIGYILGLLSTTFHFGNGLVGFCITWGLTPSKEAQKRASWASLGVGTLLFLLGTNTVIYFATGTALFVQEQKASKVQCQDP